MIRIKEKMAESSRLRVLVEKLNGENYEIWKYKMELLLIKDKLWSVVTSEPPEETEPEAIKKAWTEKDNEARATIELLVEDNQLVHIRNARSAKGAWTTLQGYHQKATLSSKIFLLKRICRLT